LSSVLVVLRSIRERRCFVLLKQDEMVTHCDHARRTQGANPLLSAPLGSYPFKQESPISVLIRSRGKPAFVRRLDPYPE